MSDVWWNSAATDYRRKPAAVRNFTVHISRCCREGNAARTMQLFARDDIVWAPVAMVHVSLNMVLRSTTQLERERLSLASLHGRRHQSEIRPAWVAIKLSSVRLPHQRNFHNSSILLKAIKKIVWEKRREAAYMDDRMRWQNGIKTTTTKAVKKKLLRWSSHNSHQSFSFLSSVIRCGIREGQSRNEIRRPIANISEQSLEKVFVTS